MRIPGRHLDKFVRELADQCLISQQDRINRYQAFMNYAEHGSDDPGSPAMFNKTYAYLDDLESLLYSPVSLRWHIADNDVPNVVMEAKGRAAAAKLRQLARKSNTDSLISRGVRASLNKGKGFLKQTWKRGAFSTELVQPESMGVLYENHGELDEDMEAFVHTMWITPYQFHRLIINNKNREELLQQHKNYMRETKGKPGPPGTEGAQKQVIVGGMYPFQPGQPGSNTTSTRGIVDWMGGRNPMMAPEVIAQMLPLHELWAWDDEREDWTTFQIIGEKMLIEGRDIKRNLLAYDPVTLQSNPTIKGMHPFLEFCVNPTDDYFWGASEIVCIALLQTAINSRINGTNAMLRMQEDPVTKFMGVAGVNQTALAKVRRPGGYWNDANPNAKMERDKVEIPQDLWASLHEYERMFDELGGLPPIARGHGEAGVRSHNHAETLVRMFSPRFKDRALLVERNVEAVGGHMLELGRAHIAKKMFAWVPEQAAGNEGAPNSAMIPPAPGLVPVPFAMADLDEDVTLSVDSHSSSPAFAAEAKALIFDLFKIQALSAEQVVERVDISDPEGLVADIQRRGVEKQQLLKEQEMHKLAGKKH